MSKIGELRLIPSGTSVWSIGLQHTIKFDNDIIVEITNTVYSNDDYFYGKIAEVTFPMLIPGIRYTNNGEISLGYSNTKYFEMPKGITEDFKCKE